MKEVALGTIPLFMLLRMLELVSNCTTRKTRLLNGLPSINFGFDVMLTRQLCPLTVVDM